MEKWRFVGPQSYAISALLRSTRAGFQTVSREGTIYGNTYIYIVLLDIVRGVLYIRETGLSR